MANNNTYKRPVLPWGNSFYINISLEKFNEGAYEDFDLTKATDLKVYLICATHNTEIPLDYEIVSGMNNVLRCFVDYRLLHTTSYGVVVEGYDDQDIHFRFEMLPKEGFLIVSNTSGMYVTDDVQVIDISGRVGWGISYNGDLTNYYTKTEVDNLIAEIEIELGDYYTKDEISELLTYYPTREEIDNRFINYYTKTQTNSLLSAKQDTLVSGSNIKTINNLSLLGSGNIEIQGGGDQVQSDWTQTDTTDPSYIKNKPNLSQVATSGSYNDLTNKPDLSIYATKTELDDKQDELESGVNIKTINNLSLLGSGNIDIQGGGSVEPIIVTYGETISNETLTKIREQKTDVIMYNGTASIYVPLETIHTTYLRFTTDQPDNNNTFSTSIYTYTINTSSWNIKVKAFYDTRQIDNELDDKQDELESGVNIKTINNLSLLGSGNIDIQGGGGDYDEQFETTADALWDLNNRIERNEKVTEKKLDELKESTTETLDDFSEEVNTQLGLVTDALVEQSGFTKLESHVYSDYKKGRLRPCGIVNLTDVEPPSYEDQDAHEYIAANYTKWKTGIQENLGHGSVVLAFNGLPYGVNDNVIPKASGPSSICAGLGSKSLGWESVAMGRGAVANGTRSIALGDYVETSGQTGSFACGHYSLANTDTQFAVGNGGGYVHYGQTNPYRHNALEIKQNGDIYIADTSYIGEYYEAPMIKLQDALGGGGSGTQSDWNETDTTSLAYIQNKPTIQDPGFKKVGYGAVIYSAQNYNTNIGGDSIIVGSGPTSSQKIEATQSGSIAFGRATHAIGLYSLAGGNGSYAQGYGHVAIGDTVTTNSLAPNGAAAFGTYNKPSTTTVFTVGNGTSSSNKHNAIAVHQNGDIYITLNGSDIKLQDLLSQLAAACNITI